MIYFFKRSKLLAFIFSLSAAALMQLLPSFSAGDPTITIFTPGGKSPTADQIANIRETLQARSPTVKPDTPLVSLPSELKAASPEMQAAYAEKLQKANAAADTGNAKIAEGEQNFPLAAILLTAATGAGFAAIGNIATQKFLGEDDDDDNTNVDVGGAGFSGFGGADNAALERLKGNIADLRDVEQKLGGRDALLDVISNPQQYLPEEEKAKLAALADGAGDSGLSADAYYEHLGDGEGEFSSLSNSMKSAQREESLTKLSYLNDHSNSFPAGGLEGAYAYGGTGSGSLGSTGSRFDMDGIFSKFLGTGDKSAAGGLTGRSLAGSTSAGKGNASTLPDNAPLLFQAIHQWTPTLTAVHQTEQIRSKMEDEARARRLVSLAPEQMKTPGIPRVEETLIVSQPIGKDAKVGIPVDNPVGVGVKIATTPLDEL